MVQFILHKFDHRRPMGRKNFFLTSAIYFIPYAAIFISLNIEARMDIAIFTTLIISIPLQLLQFRRAKAANIPLPFIIASMVLIPFELSLKGGMVETSIQSFQLALTALLILLPNKIEPLSP